MTQARSEERGAHGESGQRDPGLAWHLLGIIALSAAYEALFVSYGINLIDEAWPLTAVRQLAQGGQLYRDVLFVFPLGHLLPAWIAYHLDPPGLVLARVIYAAFAVALSAGMVLLARRIMRPPEAILATIAIAIAAPNTHLMHSVFGYRYMIFSVLALLAFAKRFETGDVRWMGAAGLLLGVGAFFRLGPVFAAGCGLGVAVMVSQREWRQWLRDWAWLAAGILVVLVPLAVWAAVTVGLPELWREIVTRPATMLLRQSLPFPPFQWLEIHPLRRNVRDLFIAFQIRAIWVLCAAYFVALTSLYVRSRRRGRAFEHGLLVAVLVWATVFFVRSTTRSDEPHLDSVLPPVFLLVACASGVCWRAFATRMGLVPKARWRLGFALSTVALASWVFLVGTDTWLPRERRGSYPIEALDGRISVHAEHNAQLTDNIVRRLKLAPPDARILDLTASPGYLHLADRRGYGTNDIVMPGTFLTESERLDYFERVRRAPPLLVIMAKRPFDNDPEKDLSRVVPELSAWVRQYYVPWGQIRRHTLWGPRLSRPPAEW